MSLDSFKLLDDVVSPQVAVPVVGTAGVVNTFVESLPLLINVLTLVYIVLLVSHKGYTMYREWKEKRASKE